jgi:exonuclease I
MVELKRAENRLEMLLVHYTARQYWPRLKKEAFRRLQIAP